MDATYRSDLRNLNESELVRLDAGVEQRLRASERKYEQRLDALETRFERRLADQFWMLAAWFIMMTIAVGTLFAVLRAR